MTIAMRGGEQISSDLQSTETGEAEEGNPGDKAATDGVEPEFPHQELKKLDEMISRPRWVIPVLPGGELEVLLEASTDLCKKGVDTRSDACQRFFRDGLTISFTKILTDEAVSGWKHEIHRSIMKNCERLMELCVVKLSQDWYPLLELLAMALNPSNKFHMFNSSRPSDSVPPGTILPEDELFARPPDPRTPRGWLVDLINRFGVLGGFQILLDRLQGGEGLSVLLIYSLLRPFGLCCDLLTGHTLQKYFLPILEMVPGYLDSLSDEELKKEAKNESKNDALPSIIKYLKSIASKLPNQVELAKNLEMFRLKMILRLLQISSFNGKMNALNEVNKVIGNVAGYPHRHTDIEEWLTPERMADWIKENKVLQIVLCDSLHQPQYVEKLEKIIRFVIREKALAMEDLDNIWAAQVGKHEVIVKNVHDLLAKLAWDFTPDQLDHLFTCFQVSWSGANRKQREKLLELIRRLAEDDKEGVMAHKVLTLLWSLAHSTDTPTEIMDQALTAHIKILDYSCSQDRDNQKMQWLERCVEELRDDKWVLPALKHIREICCLYKEAPQNLGHTAHPQRSPHSMYRHELVNRLQQQRTLVISVTENLTDYIEKIRRIAKDKPNIDPNSIYPDGRYNHVTQVQERLSFLRFLLKDGQLWLCATQAKQIWHCLAENAVFACDREACFWWFSKLMGEEPDLDPDINRHFFEENILQLDPTLMTESGIKCFDRFFKAVNSKERKLSAKRHAYLMEDFELIGLDYIWRVILCGGEDIANRAIELLKETYTNLGPKLQANQMAIHEDFISGCIDRLKAAHDTISVLDKDKDCKNKFNEELKRMCRVLKVLYEYVSECDNEFGEDRHILPLYRAYRGRHMMLVIRFSNQGRQADDLEVWVHTNETLGNLRRQVLHRLKLSSGGGMGQVGQHGPTQMPAMKLDLFLNGEVLDPAEDKKLIGVLPFRDKTVLTGKLCQLGSNMPSSPESSSDSSAGSPQHPNAGSPSAELENYLPGVVMCNQPKWMDFLLSLADMGCTLNCPRLRDMARSLLQLLPPDLSTMDRLTLITTQRAAQEPTGPTLDSLFLSPSPSTVLYYLQVTYVMLMPATNPIMEKSFEFQQNFIKAGGIPVVIAMITKNNFLSKADIETKRSAYIVVFRLLKLLLTVVGHANLQESAQSPSTTNPFSKVNLRDALATIPHPTADVMIRNVAVRLVQHLPPQTLSSLKEHIPDVAWIRVIIKMIWAAASGHMELYQASDDELHQAILDAQTVHSEDNFFLCKEALDTMTVGLLLKPGALKSLLITSGDNKSRNFITDLLLISPVRIVRGAAVDQFLLMATKCCSGQSVMVLFVGLLFSMLNSTVTEHANQSMEYFTLLCRLLSFACSSGWQIPESEALLNNEISWLKKVRENVKQSGDTGVEEALLEGHLGVTKELVSSLPSEKKFHIGSDESKGINLIKELVEDFVFPASKLMLSLNRSGELPVDQIVPVCCTPATVLAGLDLLVALSTGCVPNLKLLSTMLIDMYFSDDVKPVVEWEYVPPVGPRPPRGFVGLKNAGATCYMNSVLQQLYMIEPIRVGILSAEGAATNLDEDFSGEERFDNEVGLEVGTVEEEDKGKMSEEEARKEYNIGILKHVQAIFGHLAYGRLQYYVPRGLWKHFRLAGEPVNLREQHDALEFFSSLIESVDDAMKALNCEQVMSKVLGGTFADQKICKGCPHRYSREDSFLVLNTDVRNQSNLLDSLEQYVKGDLLEGANAYHCEKCDRKVDTVKRVCIKKLPPIMAIQLKRFDYDWERECALKFNDYFEFPRELDMEPYTVSGVAKLEGEVLQEELEGESNSCCKYSLTGIVVHSGQASGGHYYSYILHRYPDGSAKWYKFDDGEVSEWKMEDEEEMRNQCFGGEYVGEVFDHISKRVNCRRQKRWWNAFILFYTRDDVGENLLTKSMQDLSLSDTKQNSIKMPAAIERSVCKMNVRFLHNRNQYSPEFFQFMRKLMSCNAPYLMHADKVTPFGEELALTSIQLASRFLFTSGFHTKKSLRGSSNDWYEGLCIHLRASKNIRVWFAVNVLFAHSHRFCEYILECPSSEVRSTFVKIIVLLCHYSLMDETGPVQLPPMLSSYLDAGSSLSDQLLIAVLALLKKEVAEHGRHLAQYFSLFLMYASIGTKEKAQLLRLNIPELFMQVALDEGPGPPIKYQYADLSKLYQVVSLLIRCTEVSSRQQSSHAGQLPGKNPFAEGEYIMPIQPAVAEILFDKVSYIKKMIEDGASSEETVKLVKFCSWECAMFSSAVLSELLWQIAFSYTYELRPYLDLLLHLLLMEDSWQSHRIHNALKGIPNDREGLFDTIQRSKNHYQKRAYQCIKCMVHLFSNCQPAAYMLQSNGDFKRKWSSAVDWLGEELERRPYSGNHQFGYSNWSPPAQSNESSNGYFLERSPSAKITYEKAYELCPEEVEPEGDDLSEEGESPQPEEKVPFRPTRTNSSGPQSLGGRTAADGDTQDRLQHRDSI